MTEREYREYYEQIIANMDAEIQRLRGWLYAAMASEEPGEWRNALGDALNSKRPPPSVM